MRFGINTFLFTSPFTTKSTSLFPKFKKWGFETVEIPIEAPEHIDSVKVKKALDRNGLVCGSVCACMGPGRDLRGNAKDQREAMKYCKALIDHMVNLGCPSLIGPVYSVVGKADAVEPKQQKKEFGRSWKVFEDEGYIECSVSGGGMSSECQREGIKSYPTWEFADGQRSTGVIAKEQLSAITGCSLPA